MSTRANRRWLAALVAAAVLCIAHGAVIPGPWHDGLSGRSCDVCRSGHLPTLASPARTELPGLVTVERQALPTERTLAPDLLFRADSPRAPPA